MIFYWGCMNSAKSLNLLATAYNFKEKGIPFMIIKSSLDTRDGDKIKSRTGMEADCAVIPPDTDIFKVVKQYNNFRTFENDSHIKWILVDECQFLTEKQIDQLSDIVDYLGVSVMCYGIRTDFKSHLFPSTKRLFEIADEFIELKSSCECGKKTIINAKVDTDLSVITEGTQIEIGAEEKYKPMCRRCWKDKIRYNNSEYEANC